MARRKKPVGKEPVPSTPKVTPEERSVMRAAIDAHPDMTPWIKRALTETLDALDREASGESSDSKMDGAERQPD